MIFQQAEFEQRGKHGYWYRIGKNNPYLLVTCENCNRPCLIVAGRGKYCSSRCAALARTNESQPHGPRHYNWKGSEASYSAKHHRVTHYRGKATYCLWGCESEFYEWANTTGDYDDPDAFAPMCRSCHRRFDNAIRSMIRHRQDQTSCPLPRRAQSS